MVRTAQADAGVYNFRQVPDRRDQSIAGMNEGAAGETDPLDPGNFMDGFEQAREVARRVVRRLVMIDDLPKQLEFRAGRWRRRRGPSARISAWPDPLVSACVRHHAERAEIVAAFDDGHVRPDWIAAPNHAKRKRRILVRVLDRDSAPGALGAHYVGPLFPQRLGSHHRQHLHLLRADDQVDRCVRSPDQPATSFARRSGDVRRWVAARSRPHLLDFAQPCVSFSSARSRTLHV